jgi:fructoselysine-6-P-deglycase FrlB-like protein
VPRREAGNHHRQPESAPHQHELRGSPESDDADAHVPLHATDERVLKKFENHVHMVALYTVFYNWTKIHKSLRTTPAMAAGLTERVWDMADIVAMIERAEAPALIMSADHSA